MTLVTSPACGTRLPSPAVPSPRTASPAARALPRGRVPADRERLSALRSRRAAASRLRRVMGVPLLDPPGQLDRLHSVDGLRSVVPGARVMGHLVAPAGQGLTEGRKEALRAPADLGPAVGVGQSNAHGGSVLARPDGRPWPRVSVIVPARDARATLPQDARGSGRPGSGRALRGPRGGRRLHRRDALPMTAPPAGARDRYRAGPSGPGARRATWGSRRRRGAIAGVLRRRRVPRAGLAPRGRGRAGGRPTSFRARVLRRSGRPARPVRPDPVDHPRGRAVGDGQPVRRRARFSTASAVRGLAEPGCRHRDGRGLSCLGWRARRAGRRPRSARTHWPTTRCSHAAGASIAAERRRLVYFAAMAERRCRSCAGTRFFYRPVSSTRRAGVPSTSPSRACGSRPRDCALRCRWRPASLTRGWQTDGGAYLASLVCVRGGRPAWPRDCGLCRDGARQRGAPVAVLWAVTAGTQVAVALVPGATSRSRPVSSSYRRLPAELLADRGRVEHWRSISPCGGPLALDVGLDVAPGDLDQASARSQHGHAARPARRSTRGRARLVQRRGHRQVGVDRVLDVDVVALGGAVRADHRRARPAPATAPCRARCATS